jgi:hypothetical protein
VQPKALWFCLGVVGVSLGSAVDAQQLNVGVGFGYEMQDRHAVSLSRSFLEVAPTYTRGRVTVTAPVQVAFRYTGVGPTASDPLGFKSDDWVDLGATGSYRVGKTQLEWEHHSHQLLSSGILPPAGFGDVERDDRVLARVPLWGQTSALARGARPANVEAAPAPRKPALRGIGGYWRMDRWTEDDHGNVGGPVLGLEGMLPLSRRLSLRAQVLGGQTVSGSRAFGEAFATLRYQQGPWFATAQWKTRAIGGSAMPEYFAKHERTVTLCVGAELR